MGYGDDLLITAFAAKQKKLYPNRQIVIGNTKKRIANHSEVFDNNPNIADCRNLDKNNKRILRDNVSLRKIKKIFTKAFQSNNFNENEKHHIRNLIKKL